MLVLGIETSCDDTAVALYDGERGLLAHCRYSQVELYNEFGGIVPELASRDHSRKLVPLIKYCLRQANCELSDLDAVAYTTGPGLIGALLTGAATGASLAYALQLPALGIHHMEGHLQAALLADEQPSYPFIALLVSGGHTLLVEVKQFGDYHVLGESLDDAAGEAFDKTAKLLGLGYPGGPALAALAEQGQDNVYRFPRPMTQRPGLDFSFSGLKTFTVTTWQKSEQTEQDKANIARAFQDAVVDTLLIKCKRALQQSGLTELVIAGGVSANKSLREKLTVLMEQMQGKVYYPELEFCTDNAAMIAFTGWQRLQQGQHDHLQITVRPRWPLNEI